MPRELLRSFHSVGQQKRIAALKERDRDEDVLATRHIGTTASSFIYDRRDSRGKQIKAGQDKKEIGVA